LKFDIPCVTTLSGAMAAVEGIAALRAGELEVTPLQELYPEGWRAWLTQRAGREAVAATTLES
jgi:hypothetical protein